MILVLAIIGTIASVGALVIWPYWGFVITLAAKPVVDASWNYSWGSVNLLDVIGVAIPLLLLPRLASRAEGIPNRIRWLALGYFLCCCLGSITLFLEHDYHSVAELWLRSLNGYIGFFLFACFFRERRAFHVLLLALLVAGIFPAVMGMYQNMTGVAWQQRQTVGLVRNVGLYHDAWSFRFYGLQTLAAILLYRSYFRPLRRSWDLLLLMYAACWLYVVFHVYSKAAILTLVVWWSTWSVLKADFRFLLWGCVGLGSLFILPGNSVLENAETVFSKEIAFGAGDIQDSRRVLAGRGFIWERCWERWKKQGPERKILGTGKNPAPHNEFLRILFCNGLLGLTINVIVLLNLGWLLLKLISVDRCSLNVVAVMVFQMWLVDCIGLHPGLYPSYQWFVWGTIGLALGGVRGLHGAEAADGPFVSMEVPAYGTAGAGTALLAKNHESADAETENR